MSDATGRGRFHRSGNIIELIVVNSYRDRRRRATSIKLIRADELNVFHSMGWAFKSTTACRANLFMPPLLSGILYIIMSLGSFGTKNSNPIMQSCFTITELVRIGFF